jgi:hypothetical protein
MRTGSPDITVGKEPPAAVAKKLFAGFLGYITVFIELFVKMLGYLGMNRSRGSAEAVKAYTEPLVYIIVNFKITAAKLFGRNAFFQGFCFCRGPVLVGAAHIQGFLTLKAAEPAKDIGGQNLN